MANAAEWFEVQYAQRSMAIYQQRGYMTKNMITPVLRFVGAEKAVFRLGGVNKAYKRTRGQRNLPAAAERKKFEVPLEDWRVMDTVEDFDLDRMNVNEREAIYEAGAMAMGRATDIEVYTQMAKAKTVADINLDGAAFSAVAAMNACKALQDDKVPWDGNVFCGLPSLQWNQFIASDVVYDAMNSGKTSPFATATSSVFWNGVHWFLMVEQDATDLYPVPAANKQDLFIWHKSAIGWAAHTDMKVETDYDLEMEELAILMKMKGACTPLQEGKGIIRFKTATNTAIAKS